MSIMKQTGNPMKLLRTLLAAFVLPMMLSPFAVAQTKDEHAGHHPEGQAPAAGTPPSAPGSPAAPGMDTNPVAAGMKRLQDLMARIESATDGEERENLMHEHMLGLLQEVKLLRSQTSGMKMGMMGGKQMESMDAGGKDAAKPDAKEKPGGRMMGGGMM